MMRDTIFISHANPKDNEFVLWLASRLQMLGYKVWCDLIGLNGGEEDFWGKRIQPKIENDAIKVIYVVSSTSVVSKGVINEISFAEAIASQNNLNDFVIPIRIEEVQFTARIGLNTYNVISAIGNWQNGLDALLKKFEEDSVPRLNANGLSEEFKQMILNTKHNVVKKEELYYSSWLKPQHYPRTFYLFQFKSADYAKSILKNTQKEYPITRHGNYLITFDDEIPIILKQNVEQFDFGDLNVEIVKKIKVDMDDLSNIDPNAYPQKDDCEYLFKRILNWSFSVLLTKRGVLFHEMSNKKQCYFFPLNYNGKNKTTIEYNNRKKNKNLVGKLKDAHWHFGISFNVQLEPFVLFNIRSHILFSNDGKVIWKSNSKLHSARRKKGRSWFNEHWRDQLMAFFACLPNSKDELLAMKVSKIDTIKFPLFTESYYSPYGYIEPKTDKRMDIINDYIEEVELETEIENAG
jgi:hypothetical protein